MSRVILLPAYLMFRAKASWHLRRKQKDTEGNDILRTCTHKERVSPLTTSHPEGTVSCVCVKYTSKHFVLHLEIQIYKYEIQKYKWRLEKIYIKTRYCCTNNETETFSVRGVKRKKKTAFTNEYSSMISYTQKKQLKSRVSDWGTVFSV